MIPTGIFHARPFHVVFSRWKISLELEVFEMKLYYARYGVQVHMIDVYKVLNDNVENIISFIYYFL